VEIATGPGVSGAKGKIRDFPGFPPEIPGFPQIFGENPGFSQNFPKIPKVWGNPNILHEIFTGQVRSPGDLRISHRCHRFSASQVELFDLDRRFRSIRSGQFDLSHGH